MNIKCCICGGGYNYLESCIDDNLFRDCNGYTCEDYSAYWFNDDYYLNLDDPSHPLSNYDYDDYESFCYYGLPEDNCPDPMTGFFAVDRCCACGGGLIVETTHPIGASSMQPTQNTSQPLTSHPNIISSENPSQILLKSTPSLFPLTQPSQGKRTEEPSKIHTSIPTIFPSLVLTSMHPTMLATAYPSKSNSSSPTDTPSLIQTIETQTHLSTSSPSIKMENSPVSLPIHLSMVPTETFSLQPVNKKINENQFETQVPSLVDYEQPVTLIKVPNIPHDKSSTNSSSSSSSSDVNLRNHKRYVILLNLIGTMVIQM